MSGPIPPGRAARRSSAPRALACLALALGACRARPLAHEPWAFHEQGAAGVFWKQPLFNSHSLDGTFDVGPVQDPLGGPPNYFHEEDSGRVRGKYELSLAFRQVLADAWSMDLGLGWRQFEIVGLQPTPDPSLSFVVDTVDALQFFVSARRVFPAPAFLSSRWRSFLEVGLTLVPRMDVASSLEFLTTSQPIDSTGAAYHFLTATGGLAWQWSDALVWELGLTWEEPLGSIHADLDSSVEFSPGQVIEIPVDAALEPRGVVGFVGLTWYPRRG